MSIEPDDVAECAHQKAIKALREAETIVIAPVDKGNATVVIGQTV